MTYYLICTLLLIAIAIGFCGLFLFKKLYRKILSLTISCASYLLLIATIISDTPLENGNTAIMMNVAAIIAINLIAFTYLTKED